MAVGACDFEDTGVRGIVVDHPWVRRRVVASMTTVAGFAARRGPADQVD